MTFSKLLHLFDLSYVSCCFWILRSSVYLFSTTETDSMRNRRNLSFAKIILPIAIRSSLVDDENKTTNYTNLHGCNTRACISGTSLPGRLYRV